MLPTGTYPAVRRPAAARSCATHEPQNVRARRSPVSNRRLPGQGVCRWRIHGEGSKNRDRCFATTKSMAVHILAADPVTLLNTTSAFQAGSTSIVDRHTRRCLSCQPISSPRRTQRRRSVSARPGHGEHNRRLDLDDALTRETHTRYLWKPAPIHIDT